MTCCSGRTLAITAYSVQVFVLFFVLIVQLCAGIVGLNELVYSKKTHTDGADVLQVFLGCASVSLILLSDILLFIMMIDDLVNRTSSLSRDLRIYTNLSIPLFCLLYVGAFLTTSVVPTKIILHNHKTWEVVVVTLSRFFPLLAIVVVVSWTAFSLRYFCSGRLDACCDLMCVANESEKLDA